MFLNIRADDSGDRSPWGDFWFSTIPFRGTPHTVTADAALRLTAVYACVRVLCESVSMLPFVLYKKGADGGKVPVTDHWLYKLFAVRPNDFQNPMEFREMMQQHLGLRGNALAQIVTARDGSVSDLIPMHPDAVTIELTGEHDWRYIRRNADGTETTLTRGEVFHMRVMSPDGIVGMNPIQASRESIATGLAAQDYGMRYFQNDATPGGWIEYPGQFKDDEQRRIFRDQWQRQQAGRNRHKTAVLEFGMKYHPIEVTNQDAQYLETRKFSRTEIATLFRIPPHMIGDLDKATFSNIEQQSLEFVVYTLTPWLVRWEAAIKSTFLDDDEGLEVEFPVLALLRGDAAARSTYYHNGILDGWLTRNEARISESYNPLDGLDEPLRPLNMVEESDAEDLEQQQTQQGTQTPPQPPEDDNEGEDKPTKPGAADARLWALADSTADRIARKESREVQAAMQSKDPNALSVFYEKHAHFVSAALGVGFLHARDYCQQQHDFARGNPSCEVEVFEQTARLKLTRLALTGSL